ncbi:hypothetical protein EC991_001685 [Linnemannia zychae]|nr:hypothetical protein EC991_001685 [Linnemannia zychae]
MTVSTSIQEDVSSELSNSKPHFREDQDQDVTHQHHNHQQQHPLSDTPRRTHRLGPGLLSRHSDEDVKQSLSSSPSSSSPSAHRNDHSQHYRQHSTSHSPDHMAQAQQPVAAVYSTHHGDKHQRSNSFDDHNQQQHHNNHLHHQRDDYRVDRESRDPDMRDSGSSSGSHWAARHERHQAESIRSPSEEQRFHSFNRHFEHHHRHNSHTEATGRIQDDHEDRGHHNEHSASAPQSDGRPEGDDAEFDETISDEMNQQEEDGEEEEDEEEEDGSEENDDDGRSSKERDASTTKNEDGSCSLTFSMYHNQKPVKVRSMFVDKLFKMVEDPSIQHLISWAKEGDMFYVYNCVELSDTILPRFFKHNNWQSFVRQLNMYGFHKIYRYDRESTLNRKRPESQRWQFYHPQFQRDFPHLRANIKRKSARSMNTAPATSRVVFEHGKGYFLQRNDRSRSNSGDGPPPPPQAQAQAQQPGAASGGLGRHPENGSPSRHASAGRQPSLNGSPRDHHPQHPEVGRGDMMAFPGYQRQHVHSDERYAVKASSVSPHVASSHDPQHGRLPPPPGHSTGGPHSSDHGSAAEERSASAALGHLRNHGLASRVSYEKGSLFALGAADASASPHHQGGGPRGGHRHSDSAVSPMSTNGSGGFSGHPNHQQYPQDSPHRPPRHHNHHHQHHGSMSEVGPGGAPLSSSSSPRGPWSAGPPGGHQERHGSMPPHPATHPSPPIHPQQQFLQQQHDSHRRGRLHSMGGGSVPKDHHHHLLQPPIPSLPSGSTFNTPHAPPPHQPTAGGSPVLSPSSAAILPPFSSPPGSSPSTPNKGVTDPYVVIKKLEHRLHSVEEAYMSLKQHTQKLQQIQVSQDRTIGWMRERLEQMTDVAAASAAGHGRRDSIASPLTPQSTASFSGNKRRAEPSPEDTRTRPRYDQVPPSHLPPTSASGPGHIQSPDLHAVDHGRTHTHAHGHGHGRHESMSGPLPSPQQQQHNTSLPSAQSGPYPRLLTSLGRIYS